MLGRQGALRTRTSELRAELGRLRAQADALNQEQATYTTYDSRVKQMAGELLGKAQRARGRPPYRTTGCTAALCPRALTTATARRLTRVSITHWHGSEKMGMGSDPAGPDLG